MSNFSIGIDPGAKYTGVVVLDNSTNDILLASTYVNPETDPIFYWSLILGELIEKEVISEFPDHIIGIEGISMPRGYKNGKLSPLNPKYVIRLGIVAGALANRFHEAVIVPPGHNGTSRSEYPDVLRGRRPADLKGSSHKAGTRNHEKSAYDIAKQTKFYKDSGYHLDRQGTIYDA